MPKTPGLEGPAYLIDLPRHFHRQEHPRFGVGAKLVDVANDLDAARTILSARRRFSLESSSMSPEARLKLPLVLAGLLALTLAPSRAADTLPSRLTDAEYWKMISEFSEPDGYFQLEIITSNETSYQYALPELTKTPRAGAFLGVGPEQNFTYIGALQPKIAFISSVEQYIQPWPSYVRNIASLPMDGSSTLTHWSPGQSTWLSRMTDFVRTQNVR